jgi:hypothetical protein
MKGFAAALTLLCVVAPVAAQTVMKVARAELILPAGEWLALPGATGDGLNVIGRMQIDGEVQTSMLVRDGAVKAWLRASATPGGVGKALEIRSTCRASSASVWALPIEGGSPTDLQCASATRSYAMQDYKKYWSNVLVAAEAAGLRLPTRLVQVSANMMRKTGAVMRIDLYAEPSFVGHPQSLPSGAPADVKAEHAAYAQQLLLRIRDCLNSITCKTEIPTISFAEAAPAAAAPNQ